MASYSHCVVVGHLTRDAELRFTSKGRPVLSASLAVNRVWKTDEGEKRESVCFVDFRLFGKLAESLQEFLLKGRPLLVAGHLHQETWEDTTTKKPRSKLLVIAQNLRLLGQWPTDEEAPATPPAEEGPPQGEEPHGHDADVPF